MRLGGNLYNRWEFAGAFGDLGTLIPFLVGYITINKIDPVGILVAFGAFKVFAGLYFKTPIPIQPMKAIGGAAIAHPGTITHGMVWASGLFTGLLWLAMGLSGAITWIARLTSKPVVRGIMLGLGLSFILSGIGMMREQPIIALLALILTFLLLTSKRVPAMLALLLFGVFVSLIQTPTLVSEIRHISPHFRLPEIALFKISWRDLAGGVLVLGIPQAPLTLGNAIIATVAENNSLFPDRPINERTVAIDHGFMNLVSAAIGGVPMCHGAGGMAGHVRFGARTGGALVILGVIVLFLGLFFSDSVATLFKMFPSAVLGVILFFAGLELAAVIEDISLEKKNVYVLIVTTGLAMWNIGVAFLAGLLLDYGLRKGLVRV